MSLNAIGIMLRPMLSGYLKPLEENGTIERLQRDVANIVESRAIPELMTLVCELKKHNELMTRLFDLIEKAETNARAADNEPGPDTGTAGFIGDHRNGMS